MRIAREVRLEEIRGMEKEKEYNEIENNRENQIEIKVWWMEKDVS